MMAFTLSPILARVSNFNRYSGFRRDHEMIGTTRSRVSSFMNKFRRLGFIDYNGHLEVHSSLLSIVLHDDSRSVDVPECANPRRLSVLQVAEPQT
jgi:hypothetical protein